MAWRLIKWAARLIFALIVVAALACVYLFYRAMPAYSGAEKLPGLSAEVRVWRDAYGVPHIFAASMDDAARALGYLHASERLFQMEIQRRVGQGRLAEIQGADLLGVDKYIRTLGFYREAESSFSALIALRRSSGSRPMPTASTPFSTATRTRCRPNSCSPAIKPEPWKPADSLVWGKLLSLQLSHNYKLEALRAHLRQKLGADEAGWLFPAMSSDSPITTKPVIDARHAADETVGDRIGDLIGMRPRRVERVGRRGIAHHDRQADPGQRSRISSSARRSFGISRELSRPKGAVRGATVPGEPIVYCSARTTISPGASPPPTPTRSSSSSRRSIPAIPSQISDARRTQAVRYARRDDPCERRGGRQAQCPHDPARSRAVRRQRGSCEHRRARQGPRAGLYRPWRSRHDRRSDDAP
jgi:penicillin amidase